MSICLHADGLAAAINMAKRKVSNPAMAFIQDALETIPAYAELYPCYHMAHAYGLGNCCADAASRDHTARLYELCASMSVRPIRVEPPAAFAALVTATSVRIRHLTEVEQALGRRVTTTEEADAVDFGLTRTPP